MIRVLSIYFLEMDVEKLRKITQDVKEKQAKNFREEAELKAQQKKAMEEAWAKRVIDSIEKKTLDAAKQGENSVLILNMGIEQVTDDKVYTSEINFNVVRSVKEYCQSSGFNIKEDETPYRDRHNFFPQYRLYISW